MDGDPHWRYLIYVKGTWNDPQRIAQSVQSMGAAYLNDLLVFLVSNAVMTF